MLVVNKINDYQPNIQKKIYKNTNYVSIISLNNICHQDTKTIAFTGNIEDIKMFLSNQYIKMRLNRVLREFVAISKQLDENNIPSNQGISENCESLLDYVKKKTGGSFINEKEDRNFNTIENMLQEQKIILSHDEKKELLKRFNLFVTRQALVNNIIQPLNFFKYLKIFKDSSSVIQKAREKMDTSIRCFGLSKKVKEIVVKTQDTLGVKLDLPDSLDLAEQIYVELLRLKKSGHSLPERISMNDFKFFKENHSALSASYLSGIMPKDYNEMITKYPSLTDAFKKKEIHFNPVFLLIRQGKKDNSAILEDLWHELGHFWHNIKIGDKAFHSKEMNTIDGFLSKEDLIFLIDLKNRLKDKVCFITDLDIQQDIGNDLSKIIPDLQNMINHRYDLGIEKVIDDNAISQFNQIVQKLEDITNTTLKQFPDCKDEAEYALNSPNELVAFAIQKRHNREYDQNFIEILCKFGSPQINDL